MDHIYKENVCNLFEENWEPYFDKTGNFFNDRCIIDNDVTNLKELVSFFQNILDDVD